MELIRGLIVDDSEVNVHYVTGRLDTYFEKYGWKVEWHRETVPGPAQQVIKTQPPFDLAVVDLLFFRDDLPTKNESRGLELIAEIHERSDRTYVFAISSGDSAHPNLFDEARSLGAHHVTHRADFCLESIEHSPPAICARIRAFLLNNGAVTEAEVIADDNDPAVQSLLHEIGKQTIAQLYGQILESTNHNSRRIQVSFLAPGASGAVVCAIAADVAGVATFRHVLKMSRALDKLKMEASQATLAANVIAPRFFVRHHTPVPTREVNGWYALGAPLLERARTLRSWLAGGPSPAIVEDVFETLFIEGLAPVYADYDDEEEGNAVEAYKFQPYKQCQILQAIDELRPALTRPEGGRLSDTDNLVVGLSLFVRGARLGDLARHELPARTRTTFTHGDAHGGNILIYEGKRPTPTLIDASNFGRGHWAQDAAKLAVDLLMRGVDTGVESLFFTRFDVWRGLAEQIGDLRYPVTAECPNAASRAALAGLNWLVTRLRDFCPPLGAESECVRNHWEWRLALAVMLLRSACHPDVPAPKRALAIVAAHEQLLIAGARH
jgi:hypothetical protein